MSELAANDKHRLLRPCPQVGGLLGRFVKLSPLNQRRLKNFKANRRGYWSFWIFMVLFVLSLFAEFLANDRPIFREIQGRVAVPGGVVITRGEVRAASLGSRITA